MATVFEPRTDDVLAFCRQDPIERVFLEDVARRDHGRFVAVADQHGLRGLCHLGTNIVPSGEGCGAFADAASKVGARMLIGEEHAVTELYDLAHRRLPRPRDDRPGQPVYAISAPPPPGGTQL